MFLSLVNARVSGSPMVRLLVVGGLLLSLVALIFPASPVAAREGKISPAVAPTFVYETIFNGAFLDSGQDVAVDAGGNAYVLASAYEAEHNVLVLKVAPHGEVLWSTYLGGGALDIGTGIDLDGAGDVYVAGWTDSADFPIVKPLQGTLDGPRDAFVTKLSAQDGSIVFSTFFGGGYAEGANDIAVNGKGEIYLIGYTGSTDFPTVNPIQGALNTTYCFCDDAFVSKISADGSKLLYSTYLGGGFDDDGQSIGLDGGDNIYIAGNTKSNDFPTVNPIQPVYAGGQRDVFAARISADGSALDYSTYLGGEEPDGVGRIAVDDAGYAHIAGTTQSVGFPTTPGAFQEQFVGGILECGSPPFDPLHNCPDLFVSKITPDGSALVYSTYIGGSREEAARGIALDGEGNAILAGYSFSSDFPPDGIGDSAAIVVPKLNSSGSDLLYTVAIASGSANAGHGIDVDGAGDLYITGAKNVPADVYVARLSEAAPPDDAMHVADLQLSGFGGRGRYGIEVVVTVQDQRAGPIEGALVTVQVTDPAGESSLHKAETMADGQAVLRARSHVGGLWRVCVTDVVKEGWVYDPSQNAKTCDSIAFPQLTEVDTSFGK
jgi:hypothetical protein